MIYYFLGQNRVAQGKPSCCFSSWFPETFSPDGLYPAQQCHSRGKCFLEGKELYEKMVVFKENNNTLSENCSLNHYIFLFASSGVECCLSSFHHTSLQNRMKTFFVCVFVHLWFKSWWFGFSLGFFFPIEYERNTHIIYEIFLFCGIFHGMLKWNHNNVVCKEPLEPSSPAVCLQHGYCQHQHLWIRTAGRDMPKPPWLEDPQLRCDSLSVVLVLNCPPRDVIYLSVQFESPTPGCCLFLQLMPLWRTVWLYHLI